MSTMQRTAIETANEVVPIVFACNQIGMGIPDLDVQSGRSFKTYCPFGEFYHDDSGVSKAFRVYPESNSAWCFACSEYYSPVKLYAQSTGMEPRVAAETLLELIGHRGVSVDQRFAAAIAGPPRTPDRSTLADALKTFCGRIDARWEARQFESPYAEWLSRCLDLLTYVSTEADAVEWLETAKRVMERELTK